MNLFIYLLQPGVIVPMIALGGSLMAILALLTKISVVEKLLLHGSFSISAFETGKLASAAKNMVSKLNHNSSQGALSPIAIVRNDGEFECGNKAFIDLIKGESRTNTYGLIWNILGAVLEGENLTEKIKESIDSQVTFEGEVILKSSGRDYFRLVLSPVSDTGNDQVNYFILSLHYITPQRVQFEKFKQELTEATRFRDYLMQIPTPAWLKDSDGNFLFVNKKFEEEFNASLSEMTLSPSDRPDIYGLRIKISEAEKNNENLNPVDMNLNVLGRDGNETFWHIINFQVNTSAGEILSAGIAYDITSKLQEDENIQRSERLYRLISENTTDLITLRSPDGYYTYVSPSVKSLLGFEADELIGRRLVDFLHPDDVYKVLAAQSILNDGKRNITAQYRIRKKNNEYLWVECSAQTILDDNGKVTHVQSVSRNISERKETEAAFEKYLEDLKNINKELLAAKAGAEQSARAKEEFLANMSHEIRTPMSAIIGLTKLLLDTNVSESQYDYLKAIEASGDTLLVIINDILDLSKIEAGKMTFEQTRFNLGDSIRFAVNLLKPRAIEKNLFLEYLIDDNIPTDLVGDPVRLNQVLLNLIGNAVKFTEKGGINIKAECTDQDDDLYYVRLSVKDTGIGIRPDRLGIIFDSFTQANSNTTRKYGGTGLGLTIVKRLVDLQGGTVGVESEENTGSTFYFTLPFKKFNREEKAKEENITQTSDLAGKTALVVEDNNISQMLVKRILESFGMHVLTSGDGENALEVLAANSVDVILMDVHMPLKDGLETTEEIRKLENKDLSNIPILAMTATALQSEADKCMEAGMDDFVSKPFQTNELFNKLAALLKGETKLRKMNHGTDAKSEKLTDLKYLRELSEGNYDFVHDMLTMFIESMPKSMVEIREQFNRKDWKNLQMTAHKIKPSYGFIGVQEAQDILREIEKLAAEIPDPLILSELITKAESYTTRCVAELVQELNS